MTYRLAKQSDSSALADLLCEHITFIWNQPIADSERKSMQDFYYNTWDDKDTVIAVYADENDQAVATGTVGIVRASPSTSCNPFGRIGFITDITVASTQRGKGLGSEIFKYLLRLCKEREVSYLLLTANEAGARVYKKFGFSTPKAGSVAMETHITTYPKTLLSLKEFADKEFRFRLADRNDIDELVRLRREFLEATDDSSIVGDLKLAKNFYETDWNGSNPIICILENVKSGEILGMAAAGFGKGTMYGSEFPTKDNYLTGYGYVFDLVVDKAHRRKGYGKAIVSYLLSELAKRNVGYLILSAPNKESVALFEKFAFEVADEPDSFGLEATWDSYVSSI